MTIDIEKLADECGAYIATEDQGETPFMTRGEMIFDAESLYNFAEAYAAKVLEDKEREIAELKADYLRMQESTGRISNSYLELQAHINVLREALEDIVNTFNEETDVEWMRQCYDLMTNGEETLKQTPAQSLQSVINATIETCANDLDGQGFNHAADAIRALKGK